MHALLLVSSFAAASCLVAPQKPAPAEKGPESVLFPVPAEGISIKAGGQEGMKLSTLLDEFTRVTGQNLLLSKETRTLLERSETGLNRDVVVPPQEVYFFVESILANQDFAMAMLSDREPRLLGVTSLSQGGQRGNLRSSAIFVPVKQIQAWSRHPAFLVTTAIDLPHTDVRTLSNSMRTMFTDAQTQQIIPVGNSDSLIITGFGPNVASIVQMLIQVEDASRRKEEGEKKEKVEKPAPKEPAAK